MKPTEHSSAGHVHACAADSLAAGEAIQIDLDPPIAVFNVDGRFYATADTCTHEKSSLADGYIEGDQVECSFHFAKFCIITGAVLSLPATKPLQTYDVLVDDGEVYVVVDAGR